MFRLKFAPTVRFWLIVTEQVGPWPLQSPLQPMNVEPPSANAVSVTGVWLAYGCEQSLPQVIPGLSLVTRPEPLPGLFTVRTNPFRTVIWVENELLSGSGSSAMNPDPTDDCTSRVPAPGGLTLISTATLVSSGMLESRQRTCLSVA